MLKLIARFLVILLVTICIGGGLYLLVNNAGQNLQSVLPGGGEGRRGFNSAQAGAPGAPGAPGGRPQTGFQPARGDFHEGGGEGVNLQRALPGLAKNVGIFAGITLIVVLFRKALKRIARPRKAAPLAS